MPIELVTGLPGNAKTLFSIQMLIERAKREGRAIYYAGLKEFLRDDPRLEGTEWFEFDPLKLHETVPSGAICFIDEAQKVFRSRSLGSVPGKHVTELEDHRHKGLDFVMLTQHPSLIDPAIRKLTQVHRHMVRIMGMEVSTVHVWADGVKDAPDRSAIRQSSEKTKWAFPKHLYGLYKSADVHTIKRAIPWRVKLLAGLLVAFAAISWYVVSFVNKKSHVADKADSVAAVGSAAVGTGGAGQVPLSSAGVQAKPFDPVQDAKEYVFKETPRVTGLPQTAPKYDELTKPSRVPVPAMCFQIGDIAKVSQVRCKCYTQQGTPLELEFNQCVQIAQHGFFMDFDPEGNREQKARSEASQAVLADRGEAAVPDHRSPGVTVIPDLTDSRPVTRVRVTGDTLLK
jgi:zona occludens toxin